MKGITMKFLPAKSGFRPQKKNKSCKMQSQPILYKLCKFYDNSISSAQIASSLINEFLQNVQQKFQKIDEKLSKQKWVKEISSIQDSLERMMNPIKDTCSDILLIWNKEQEFSGLQQEYQIKLPQHEKVGKKNLCQLKSNINTKNVILDHGVKQQTSSGCLNKMIKTIRQSDLILIENKKTMEMLKEVPQQEIDQIQTLLRDKKNVRQSTIQNKAYYRTSTDNSFQKPKVGFLPSMEQYSYDYDGSLFPLKKFTKRNGNGPKILNTICKIGKKDELQIQKMYRVSKINNYTRRQVDENQVIKSKKMIQNHEDIVKIPRSFPADSIFQQNQLMENEHEGSLAQKIQQSILNKSIKIREITI